MSVTRRRFLQTGAAAAALALGGARGQEARRPNVLFIAVDDLNNHLGCYGHPLVQSPNLDRLAARGRRFDRAYCQYPVCNPSRSSLLTGLRPDATGVFDNRVVMREKLPDVVTLPQHFREHGYWTGRLSKIFHGGAQHDDPKAWDHAADIGTTPAARGGEGRNLTDGRVKWCEWRAANGADDDHADGRIANEAIALLEEHREDPFFLAVGFQKPHDPFVAPARYFDRYPLDQLTLPRRPDDATPYHPLALQGAPKHEFDRFTERDKREFMRAYFACTTFMDAQLGKLLDAVDRLGLADNTIVLFFGDHGYHVGEHNWWNKVTLYEICARGPLVVAGPGVAAPGTPTAGIVEFLDFYPTLADLAGLPLPGHLQGESFRRLLADPAAPGKRAAYTQVKRGAVDGRSVVTARWRYTDWQDQGAELYDVVDDPIGYHNVVDRPEHAGVVAELRALIAAQRGEGA